MLYLADLRAISHDGDAFISVVVESLRTHPLSADLSRALAPSPPT